MADGGRKSGAVSRRGVEDWRMPWHMTQDIDEFDVAAGGFIAATAAVNTLLVTVPAALRSRGLHAYGASPARLGWYESAEAGTTAACVQTPPFSMLMSEAPPDVARELADMLAAQDAASGETTVAGVNAPIATAEAFAAAWCESTGTTSHVGHRSRLYRLETLATPASPPPGSARIAVRADRELAIAWHQEFAEEAGSEAGDNASAVDERIGFGCLSLWEVDGAPVSMAGRTRVQQGTSRIAPVYTPRNLRGRGYAGAATAAVSQEALDAGAEEVLLFTDLTNPTSNALYQRIGYRPIADRVVIRFTTGSGSAGSSARDDQTIRAGDGNRSLERGGADLRNRRPGHAAARHSDRPGPTGSGAGRCRGRTRS